MSKRVFLYAIGIFLFFTSTVFFASCSLFKERLSDSEIIELYSQHNLDVNVGHYKVRNRNIRYMSVGHDSLPSVLLIHGAPSTMTVFNDLILNTDLLKYAKVYAVDRPGYGHSGLGKSETSISRQVKMIAPILDSIHYNSGPTIVLGVSYGGPVASRLAIEYPHLVDGLVLGAPAIAPGEERTYFLSNLLLYKPIRWMVPASFVVATEEKFSHRYELEELEPLWEKLRKPVIYVQGEEDDLVYTTNADFIEKKASKAPFLKILMIPGQPHFLAIPQKDVLANSIVEMLYIVENNADLSEYADYENEGSSMEQLDAVMEN
jgi:uncharacterized protein